jgi:hypothetical protein
MEGLEPPHLAASDPKSDVSTNFTTCAFGAAKVIYFLIKKILVILNGKIIFDLALFKFLLHGLGF